MPAAKQADILIALAGGAELFHTPDLVAYASIPVGGHVETHEVRRKAFRRWLQSRYYAARSGAPSAQALQGAIETIEATAINTGPEHAVHLRVGGADGRVYIDLCNSAWRCVEVGHDGWRIIDRAPIKFRRAAGMRPLPDPVTGGTVAALRPFLNVASDGDFTLAVAWLLAALRDRGPYPVLALTGEHGSAKSTFAGVLRAITDPSTAPLRALSREDRDLFIAASNGHVLCFDNVSGLPAWTSDTLCRLSTGGGFSVRQLYSDADEILFDAARPIILNGITDIVGRPDLADRSLFLHLEPIADDRRRPEADLLAAFELARPYIIGALLGAMVEGLRRLPSTRLARLPRLADFALWATACETAIWPAGTFWAAYEANRADAVDTVLEADPVASAVREMMVDLPEFSGTASRLLEVLTEKVGQDVARRAKGWPATAKDASRCLKRAMTFLRAVGIEVRFRRQGNARTRMIDITTAKESGGKSASAVAAVSAPWPNVNGAKAPDGG